MVIPNQKSLTALSCLQKDKCLKTQEQSNSFHWYFRSNCASIVLEEKENSVLVMPCGRLGLMLPRVRHTSHQIQTYVSYFHPNIDRVKKRWFFFTFYIFRELWTGGKVGQINGEYIDNYSHNFCNGFPLNHLSGWYVRKVSGNQTTLLLLLLQ